MKLLIVLFVLLTSFNLKEPEPKYTWKGKEIPYKQWRDSLKVEYLKYCDSLSKK